LIVSKAQYDEFYQIKTVTANGVGDKKNENNINVPTLHTSMKGYHIPERCLPVLRHNRNSVLDMPLLLSW